MWESCLLSSRSFLSLAVLLALLESNVLFFSAACSMQPFSSILVGYGSLLTYCMGWNLLLELAHSILPHGDRSLFPIWSPKNPTCLAASEFILHLQQHIHTGALALHWFCSLHIVIPICSPHP